MQSPLSDEYLLFAQVRKLQMDVYATKASSDYLEKEARYHEELANVCIPDLVLRARSHAGEFSINPKIVNVPDPGKYVDHTPAFLRGKSYWEQRRMTLYHQLDNAIR